MVSPKRNGNYISQLIILYKSPHQLSFSFLIHRLEVISILNERLSSNWRIVKFSTLNDIHFHTHLSPPTSPGSSGMQYSPTRSSHGLMSGSRPDVANHNREQRSPEKNSEHTHSEGPYQVNGRRGTAAGTFAIRRGSHLMVLDTPTGPWYLLLVPTQH